MRTWSGLTTEETREEKKEEDEKRFNNRSIEAVKSQAQQHDSKTPEALKSVRKKKERKRESNEKQEKNTMISKTARSFSRINALGRWLFSASAAAAAADSTVGFVGLGNSKCKRITFNCSMLSPFSFFSLQILFRY